MAWTIQPSKPDDRPPGKALAAPKWQPQDYLHESIVQGTLDPHVGQQGATDSRAVLYRSASAYSAT